MMKFKLILFLMKILWIDKIVKNYLMTIYYKIKQISDSFITTLNELQIYNNIKVF